jgi:hypothetical protein
MTFLLSEDAALRNALLGVTVSDQKSENDGVPRQVGVWFGQPDQEIRAQSYPYITIDMVNLTKDAQREMRGKIWDTARDLADMNADPHMLDYLAVSNGVTSGTTWEIDLPIPVNIDYQITTYARHPQHDRQLLSTVLHEKLPLRFGQLSLDDNTYRRLEVMGVSKRDVTEQTKRLFVNAITVRVSSEIPQKIYKELYKVQTVLNDVNEITT